MPVMKSSMLIGALLPTLLAGHAMAGPPPASPAAVVAEMKAACGGAAWDRVRAWHETSVVEAAGRPPVSVETWHDMKTLKTGVINRVDGKIVRRGGFDGASYWSVGADGRVEVGRDPQRLRRHRRDAYLSSFAWFFPERFPAKIDLDGQRRWEGQVVDVLRITPENADSFEIWVDRENRHVRRIMAENEYADLSEYRTFGDVCSATVGRQGDGDPAYEIVLRVQTVEVTAPAPTSAFSPPEAQAGR